MDDAEFEKLLTDEQLDRLLEYRVEQAMKTATPEQQEAIQSILLLCVDLTAAQVLTLSYAIELLACVKEPVFKRLIKD